MEPQSPDFSDKQEAIKKEEKILPPQIIRPLTRAIRQHISPYMKILQRELGENEAVNEFKRSLEKLEKAKEVKLVKDIPADPDDFPTFGIESSTELDKKANIYPSTTVIDKPFMPNLAIALQDYFMSSINSIPTNGSDQLISNTRAIKSFLRKVTNSSSIIITNTKTRSTIK